MVKAILIGEVINDIKLLKRGENDLFLSLLIAQGNEKVRVYANNDIAVHIADNIKKRDDSLYRMSIKIRQV